MRWFAGTFCSFAIVIQQLPEELRDPVCIFYLVLRALDTVEDDMAVPKEVKIPLLNCFHEKIYERYDLPTNHPLWSPIAPILLSLCCLEG